MATGDRKAPHSKAKVKPKGTIDVYEVDGIPTKTDKLGRVRRASSMTVHRDAWKGLTQDPSTYLSTVELAKDLGEWASNLEDGLITPYPESMYRWCKQWFGKLPPGRSGPGMGYRIPIPYRYIARVWYLTEDAVTREAAREAILADGDHPKPWVVTVANLGSTHYTGPQVADRVHSLLGIAQGRNRMVHAFYVGDTTDG